MATKKVKKKWQPREKDVERFSYGDCTFLARALHFLKGYPIYTFSSDALHGNHAFVMVHGKVLDVKGLRSLHSVKKEWNCTKIVQLSWPQLKKDWSLTTPQYGHHSYRRAKIIAKRLIEHFDLTN